MSLINKTTWSLFGAISQSLTGLISLVIITRLLNPVEAGSFIYMLWLVDTLAIVFGIGLQNSIVKFVAETNTKNIESGIINQKWIFKIFLITVLIGIFNLIIFGLLNISIIINYLSLVIIVFFTRSLGSFFLAFISGTQNFKASSKLIFSSNAIQLISLYFFINSLGLDGAFIAYIFGSLFQAILFFLKLKNFKTFKTISLQQKKRVLKYSIDTWLALLIGIIVWSKFEIFFLQKYVGMEEVAIFSVAMTLSAIVSQFPALISGPMLPYFSEQLGLKNYENINSIYKLLTILISLFIFPLSFFCAALAPKLIPLIYGDGYLGSVVPCQILVITSALSFGTVGTSVLMALEKSKFMAVGGVLGGILLAGLCMILIPDYGSAGASVARLFAQISMVALGTYYIKSKMNIDVPIKAITKIVTSSIAGATVVYFSILNIPDLYGVIFGSIFGLLTYAFFLRRAHVFNGENNFRIINFINSLPKFLKNLINFLLKIE